VQMLRAMKTSPKVRKMAAATIVFAAILDIVNRAIGGDDDDGEPRYDKIPDFIKERNLIIMLPSGGGDFIKIPLGWGYNVLHVFGQTAGESLTQKRFKPAKSAARVAAAMVGAFNPVGGSESILQFLSPTITDPLVQWAENSDWSGQPLRPASNPFGVDTPNSQKYWNSVRAPSKWITDTLNELTGGNEVRPGAIDISPEAIDLLIDTFTGGAGKFVSDIVSTPLKLIQDEDIESYEVPVLRKVYGRPGKGGVTSDYYENTEKVRLAEKEFKHYMQDPKMRSVLRTKYASELSLVGSMKAISSAIEKVKKARKRAEAKGDKEKAKRYRDMENKLMEQFNIKYIGIGG